METTKEDLIYYKEHPEELENYVNKDYIHIRFLRFFFFLSLIIVFVTKTMTFYYSGIWSKYITDVLLDIIYKCGLALLGGTITAYLLGYLRQREYVESMKYRNMIHEKLKEEEDENK